MRIKKLSIIIVHWNTPDELKAQISKLPTSLSTKSELRGASKFQKDTEIIVVDNASKRTASLRECFRILKKKKIKLLKNRSNLGYAAGCNQAAEKAKGEWLMFLNPDTHITSRNALLLLKRTEEQCFDAVSPQPTSDAYYKPLPSALSLLVEFSPIKRFVSLQSFRARTLFGGGLLIRKTVFKRVGGWDKRFFLWFEDSDLTKRLLDMKFRVGWVTISHKHKGGISFEKLSEKRKKYIFFKSMNKYAKKHFNLFGQLVVRFLTLLNA